MINVSSVDKIHLIKILFCEPIDLKFYFNILINTN
jgi:hypothetical protein